MVGIELLHNSGIDYIGEQKALEQAEKTFIVIGVARGGTSVIAGALDKLGVFTGEKSVQPVFEDVKLATAFENNDLSEAKKIIELYDQDHDIWAFKRPASIKYIDELHKMCRNPIYLFVFKDIFSIANRNNISMKQDIINGLQNAHSSYAKILDFLSKKKNINAFLFSYEKVMNNKESFIDVLINAIGKENISNKEKKAVLNFIEPNPKAYLDVSRITRSMGEVTKITASKVIGWGKYVHSDEAATVELYINGELVQSKSASDLCRHVSGAKPPPKGNYGYLFDLKDTPLKTGDRVAVKLTDDIHFLKNSNQIFTTSKIRKSIGIIGKVDRTKISGWGKYVDSNDPATVELYINDEPVQTKLAKDFRQHILDAKIHPTGHCGYSFDLSGSPLKNGDKVSVKLTNDINFLQNSNQIFKKKIKECIVHIGLHKTGSSSIQNTLNNADIGLDFVYLNLGIPNHSIPIYSLFTEKPEQYYIHKRKGLSKENVIDYNKKMMTRLINGIDSSTADKIIISGEDISGLSKPALKKFKEFLQLFFSKVTIVAYVRNPYSFMQSSFQERVKGGLNSFTIDKGYPHYRAKIKKFDDLFGRENVLLYHFDKKTLYKEDVVLDFCQHIGIKLDPKKVKQSNESISRETLSLLYIYYKFGKGYGVGPKVVQENNQLTRELDKLGNTKLTFSPGLLKPILEKYRNDIEWIETRMGISFDESVMESKNDIQSENDLLKVDPFVIKALQKRIGKYDLPKDMKADLPEAIAELVHILRKKLSK